MAATRKDATFKDGLGVTIHYHVWSHPSPKAVIQLVHGVGEYALRYERVAEALVAAGYEVWADDHRGHGRTGLEQWGEDRSKLGRLGKGGHRAAVDAVHRLSKLVKAARPGIPFVLFGHSWGSFISQILLDTYPKEYDLVVLSGSAYRVLTGMNAAPLNARHKKTVADPTGFEWLSRDPELVAKAAADPLMVATPLVKLFGIRETLRLLGKPRIGLAAEHDVPLLLIVGSDDPVGGERSVRRLAEAYLSRARLTDVEVIVYDGARHEVLNETNADEVIADVIAWLDARVG
ncbi:MAG TPA: alpha/beta hydrolase [Microbacteriaceae bacterium]|nr:alpha/beta hydrolase [Microbacteriaceae bacterium]